MKTCNLQLLLTFDQLTRNSKDPKPVKIEIGSVVDQYCEIRNYSYFFIWMFGGKSKLLIYTKYLINNWSEKKLHKFVHFSDLAKNWYICTHIIVHYSVAKPLDPIFLYKWIIILRYPSHNVPNINILAIVCKMRSN